MKNKIIIYPPTVKEYEIDIKYEIQGDWKEAFNLEEVFSLKYSINISKVPPSVAIIPFLANVLPISWVYDAEIFVDCLDKEFYECIEAVKKGYAEMYPMMKFQGALYTARVAHNDLENQDGVCAFFSGGVDAFNTLTQHYSDRPTLLTLWGADVELTDLAGWDNVKRHIEEVSDEFDVDAVTVRTSFRTFIKEGVLGGKVAQSGDGWWHGFQHGIGIISHAAPAMYALKKKTVYFASSFTAADKGRVTCASDPSIDNFVRFCGCNVIHDGYEFTRQMKVHNITQFSKISGKKIALRVCWESEGGSNCCNCEKCWRTILGVYAEKSEPLEFGFSFSKEQLKRISHRMRYKSNPMFGSLRYQPIQNSMRRNISVKELPKEIRWFYTADLTRYDKVKLYKKVWRKIFPYLKKMKDI